MAATKSGILRKAMLGVGGLLIALLVALILFRSSIVEQIGKFALDLYGFDGVMLTVNDVSLDQVTIKELSLSDQIILRDTRVQFAPFALLRGEIEKAEITELVVDISHPDEGAIRRTIDLVEGGEKDNTESAQPTLPEIVLKSGKVTETRDARSFIALFSGSLSIDQKLTSRGTAKATLNTPSGPILTENLAFSVNMDIPEQSATVTLDDGIISHESPTPDWSPLRLSGHGDMTADHFRMGLSVETSDGQPLVDLSGQYEIASKVGTIDILIDALSFQKNGLQPVNLTRYAQNLPPFDGTVTVAANAQVSGADVTYNGEITFEKLAMDVADGTLSSERLPIDFQGKFDLEKKSQFTKIALQSSDVLGRIADQKLMVTELAGDLDVQNFTETIEIKKLSGMLSDAGPIPNFAPLLFDFTGRMTALQQLSLEGKIQDRPETLSVDITAGFETETGVGSLSFSLPETKFGGEGVQLSALSRHLKDVGSSLSGVLSANGEVTRNGIGNLLFSSLKAELQNGRWQDKTLLAEGISLAVSGGQETEETSFDGNIAGDAQNIRFGDQNIGLSGVTADFSYILRNLIPTDEGRVFLTNAQISPKEGAVFKETQNAKGRATLKGDTVDFTLGLTSDFLGQYLDLAGKHSLTRATGSAIFTVKPLSFSDKGLQPSDLIALDTEMTVAGGLSPTGVINWSKKGIASSADITIEDIYVKTKGGSISGITGKLHIDELAPLTIISPQELTARDALAGIPLERPVLRFRIKTKDGFPILYIDRLTVGLVGGAAFIENAQIDTGAETNRLELQLTRLDLEEVMALSNVEELAATGRVSGKIPLIFGGARLLVEEGHLAADGPGVLKMTSAAARQALGGGGDQAKLLLDVLENFHYSELSIQITKTESGEDTVKLHAAGSNPDVENNRPIILNINLSTSLDKIFNAILEGYLLSERALRATVDGR